VCFPYTSQNEIATAIKEIVAEVEAGRLDVDNITEFTIEDHLFTRGCPPLDLLVRTSGVRRLSDFMLWQCHQGTAIEFVNCLWPEFNIWRFIPILVTWSLSKLF